MESVALLLIAVGLAMDAFAVSLCKGLAMRTPTPRAVLLIGLWFGVFQAGMPVIGYFLGASFYGYIADYDHWIAFGLLALIGANMIREALGEDEEADDDIGVRTMFILAVATSIDALAVGITLAMEGADIVSAAAVIGMVTFALSAAAVMIGSRVGGRYGKRAELVGGAILIIIGLKILFEHLGLF